MQYTRLGNSGLIVSRVCLGTMVFGENGGRGTGSDTAAAMIKSFIQAGGNFIDTADVYSGGRAEEIVGAAIAQEPRERLVIATKGRFPTGSDQNAQGLSRKHLIDAVHSSLRRLRTDYIDSYYLHMWDPATPLEETVRTLDDLVRQGKVRYFGLSNFRAWQAMKIQGLARQAGIPFIAAQYQYSLVVRDIEYELPSLCAEEGLGIVPWGPLGGGFLSGKYSAKGKPSKGRLASATDEQEEAWSRRATERNWRILTEVNRLAAEYHASTPQVALAWLLARPQVDSVIIGARTPEQLEDNLASVELELREEQLQRLDEVSRLPELYPYRMIDDYGSREW
ncbi:aldo/keto reductase [Spirochaeta africana]|uniref:Putative oxidoreductase, aryl-alcohol dehydrogenase like protein n=1 Tax=Spirochaeta africana (strain ATCC 700263 / DSM 8902 / Z-7692) TaxID=889378 RepID=H9UKP3_SPIAZ|nr:aldo/keto reductase [Spirochaeta africana]AFG38086.1 putative oxidoreductase, aryl-alcohol dehydrogenase like protein [Spirochaeta africana DSM 8902]